MNIVTQHYEKSKERERQWFQDNHLSPLGFTRTKNFIRKCDVITILDWWKIQQQSGRVLPSVFVPWAPSFSRAIRHGSLTVVAVMSLRRSGISDLLGLLALLTIGLEGGRLWLPITLQLALRDGIRPSRSSRSPVLVGLLLGCMTGMEGPPLLWRTAERRHIETHIRNILCVWHGRKKNPPGRLVRKDKVPNRYDVSFRERYVII